MKILIIPLLFFFTLKVIAQTPSYVPTNGLVGWWPFNGNANDESGNNNHGIPQNGTVLSNDRYGNSNTAYSFDGVNDYMSTPVIQTNINSYSVSVWFKSQDNFGWLFQGSRNCNSSIGTRMWLDNGKLGYGADAPGYNDAVATNSNLNDNIWHHAVGVWNGVGNNTINQNQFSIYIDGLLVSQTPQTSVGTGGIGGHRSIPINGSSTCSFGKESCNTSTYYYSGLLDDIGIWNRALTQQEITLLYASCTTPTATIIPQGNTTFCQGNSVDLNATSGTSFTYEWYKDGTLISNATNNIYNATQSGNYSVKVLVDGCFATSAETAVVVNTLPSDAVTVIGNTTICDGDSVALSAQGIGTYLWDNGDTTKTIYVKQTGNYAAIVTENGCSSTTNQTAITVNPLPNTTITPVGNTSFCQGGYVVLNASTGNNYSYVWYKDGNSINGSTGNSIIAIQSGAYTLKINDGQCENLSAITTVTELNCAGITENEFEKITIFPNPTLDNIMIETPFNEGSITVVDLHGQIILSSKITEKKTKIDLKDSKPGTYTLIIKNHEKNLVYKIVKY